MGKTVCTEFKYNKSNNSDGNQIDDKGMVFLHKFTSLRRLYLSGNKITWKGVEILSGYDFPHLDDLDLSNEKDNLGRNKIGDEIEKFPKLK